ncbi:hypothetical protein [Granulicoccus phenolivorans]|uniref:hypothetical protein n=1 Tax=Granulicoccus phenolivorans TaxID=266854 RepID=UPI00041C17CF|nr:hypothetical protein [Granulicoccus phenolivorans]
MTGQPLQVGLVVLTGMAIVFGGVAIAYGLRHQHPRLADALDLLDGHGIPDPAGLGGPARTGSERAGLWLFRHTPVPLLDAQRRLLELRQKPLAEFYADKLIWMILGAAFPSIIGTAVVLLLGGHLALPVLLSLVCAIAGYFVPDVLLLRSAEQSRADAAEALFTYFDLVILERMANRSGTQALHSAAELSDNPLFRAIRGALARARLEQQAPYAELRRLGRRLRLPELVDLADVMALDDSGAALSEPLRARVRELRDAHLAEVKVAAHNVSERMTLWMALPAMIFGLIFLIPPLLTLIGI